CGRPRHQAAPARMRRFRIDCQGWRRVESQLSLAVQPREVSSKQDSLTGLHDFIIQKLNAYSRHYVRKRTRMNRATRHAKRTSCGKYASKSFNTFLGWQPACVCQKKTAQSRFLVGAVRI